MTADSTADYSLADVTVSVFRVVEMFLKIPVSNELAGQQQVQPAPWPRQATRGTDWLRFTVVRADCHDAASEFDHQSAKSMPLSAEEQRVR